MFVIDYLMLNRPYEDHKFNIQEIVNECTVLVAAYPLLTFTNWIGDFERLLEAGWAIVGCIAFSVIFNIAFLFVSVCMGCVNKLKLRYKRN